MAKDERQAWLDGLKAGDPVALTRTMSPPRIVNVTARTPSGRIRIEGFEFDRHGWLRGDHGWHAPGIEPVTEEIREEVFRAAAVKRLHNVLWNEQDTATLRAVLAAIERGVTS